MMKGKDNYANKIMNPNLEDDMPISDATYLKSRISSELFQEIYDETELDETVGLLRSGDHGHQCVQ